MTYLQKSQFITYISPISFKPSSTLPTSNTTRWWLRAEEEISTVAIVTGANKGIGYAVVKKLAELGLSHVILTARDESKGLEALKSLHLLGLTNVHFHSLDISNPSSISSFVFWFLHNFNATLDILVNNAAVCFNEIGKNSVENAETVMKTNFYGTKLLTQFLLPLFRHKSLHQGRILNITSRLGTLDKLKNPTIKMILGDRERVNEEQIENVVNLFLEDVKNGTWETKGWPEMWTDYSLSKIALNTYTVVLARKCKDDGISVNSFCPGFTKTSMTDGRGNYSADDAANVVAGLVLLPSHRLQTGMFYIASSSRGVCNTNSKL